MELDRPQHDRPAACVIAQQYSSATFYSLRFHSHKENFGIRCKNVINSIYLLIFFFNFRNLKQLERGVYVNMEIWGNGSWQGEKPKCDTFSSHLHCLALESEP